MVSITRYISRPGDREFEKAMKNAEIEYEHAKISAAFNWLHEQGYSWKTEPGKRHGVHLTVFEENTFRCHSDSAFGAVMHYRKQLDTRAAKDGVR